MKSNELLAFVLDRARFLSYTFYPYHLRKVLRLSALDLFGLIHKTLAAQPIFVLRRASKLAILLCREEPGYSERTAAILLLLYAREHKFLISLFCAWKSNPNSQRLYQTVFLCRYWLELMNGEWEIQLNLALHAFLKVMERGAKIELNPGFNMSTKREIFKDSKLRMNYCFHLRKLALQKDKEAFFVSGL